MNAYKLKNIPFEKSFASTNIAKYWSLKNIDENGNFISPLNVSKGTDKKYFLYCNICDHHYLTRLRNVSFENSICCPHCTNLRLCEEPNCKFCFDKSFASSFRSENWSLKNTDENGNFISPRSIFKHTNSKYIFDCKECGHDFQSSVSNITKINNPSFCSFCANMKLCENEHCQTCFYKSLASDPFSKYWSSKNKITPRGIFKGSSTKYWFICKICDHEFDCAPSTIRRRPDYLQCSYCSSQKLCPLDKDCQKCYQKSLASHNLIFCWSPNNKIDPRQVFKNSGKKFLFICTKCSEEFEGIPDKFTKGCGSCPKCLNITEQKLFNIMLKYYPELQRQFSVSWCKNINYLPFDFVLLKLKIIIELDGRQHFKQVNNWNSPEDTQKTDKYKTLCANNNDFSVIRLLQEDVYYDKNDWKNNLIESIDKIQREGIIQNIFICDGNEYINHQS